MSDVLLKRALLFIAVVTVLSGLVQLSVPGFVLGIISTDDGALSRQLFATVGMFMMITGALFLQTLLAGSSERVVPFWIAVQKILAFLLVSYGVWRGIFLPLSLGVGGFDAISGAFALWYWRRLA